MFGAGALSALQEHLQVSLFLGARQGRTGEVRRCLSSGAQPDFRDANGACALHVASKVACVEELLAYNANVNVHDVGGRTPLHYVFNRETAILARLLQAGANPNEPDNLGVAPIHVVARTGRPESVALFLQHGANVNARDAQANTPLHEALQRGLLSTALTLTEWGANLDSRNEHGQCPLDVCRNEQERNMFLQEISRRRAPPMRRQDSMKTFVENSISTRTMLNNARLPPSEEAMMRAPGPPHTPLQQASPPPMSSELSIPPQSPITPQIPDSLLQGHTEQVWNPIHAPPSQPTPAPTVGSVSATPSQPATTPSPTEASITRPMVQMMEELLGRQRRIFTEVEARYQAQMTDMQETVHRLTERVERLERSAQQKSTASVGAFSTKDLAHDVAALLESVRESDLEAKMTAWETSRAAARLSPCPREHMDPIVEKVEPHK